MQIDRLVNDFLVEKKSAVVPSACPNQFLERDFGHAMMRRLWRAPGLMNTC
ncbi:MAG: hypothetical protein ACM3QS_05255 [Bacteroidota bacterium]